MYKQISGMKEIIENHNNDEDDITDESNVALWKDQSDLVVKWWRTNSSAELCSMPLQQSYTLNEK